MRPRSLSVTWGRPVWWLSPPPCSDVVLGPVVGDGVLGPVGEDGVLVPDQVTADVHAQILLIWIIL